MVEARDIQVSGIVQGVGFRPFVYRLARRYLVNGWVLNAADGVFIHAEGEEGLLDEFILEISQNPPAAARVDKITIDYVPLQDFTDFEIRFSDETEVEKTTLVSPDLATCDDCLAEMFDPANRRYHYPFINCTNCGPRFTIIDALPYDRPSTSMKDFPMCASCAAEYADPADRRFHAQPDACFTCGPRISFAYSTCGTGEEGEAPFATPRSAAQSLAGSSCASLLQAFNDELLPQFMNRNGVQRVATGASPSSPCVECVEGRGFDTSGRRMMVAWGETREEADAIIEAVVQLIREGGIVAVKGIGGFHLVCDASNEGTLAELRRRKKREGKAFAVMVRDIESAHEFCEVSEAEEALLASAARPIVLLRKKPDVQLAAGLADKLPELGVMLPATPLQHLLVRAFDGMLVMTSGNIHDEPIQIDDEQAYVALAGVADAFLGNNRPIRTRYDDSVVRVLDVGGGETMVQFIRRARGYAPLPIPFPGTGEEGEAPFATPRSEGRGLGTPRSTSVSEGVSGECDSPASAPCPYCGTGQAEQGRSVPPGATAASASSPFVRTAKLMATGPEQKCTFCLTRPGQGDQAGEAFVSQHIGDMENSETFDAWLQAKDTYERLLQIHPNLLACDAHPEYLTSKWAAEQNLPVIQVQHHHAHIVSAMAENELEGPVCGIAFDGTGYGADGALWGGEVLLANMQAFERFANFAYIPLPGGAAAIKHPLRCAYGALWAFDLLDHPAAASVLEALDEEARVCQHMIDTNLNTPYTSSVGRLFDAASAILGVCTEPTYEGEPAVLLEAALYEPAAPGEEGEAYAIDIIKNTASKNSTAQDTSVVLFDAAPVFKALLDDKAAGVPTAIVARRFHAAIVQAIVQAAQLVRAAYGISTVVLSGGVFMNRYLVEHALPALANEGFNVAVNKNLPPNDACISYGQAVVAWHTNHTK